MRPLLVACLLFLAPFATAAEVTLFAAASLTDVATELGRHFSRHTGTQVRTAFAASSTLARQIEAGAPADVYMSADRAWMAYLAHRDRVRVRRLAHPVRNELVVIAPEGDGRIPARIPAGELLTALPRNARLAVGDPAHVPAGRYARQALEATGQWTSLAPRLARADDVRSALALVSRGAAPLGIVYATDAAISTRVRVVAGFPADTHDPIVYPVGLLPRDADGAIHPAAEAFVAWIGSPSAAPIWRRHGFRVAGEGRHSPPDP